MDNPTLLFRSGGVRRYETLLQRSNSLFPPPPYAGGVTLLNDSGQGAGLAGLPVVGALGHAEPHWQSPPPARHGEGVQAAGTQSAGSGIGYCRQRNACHRGAFLPLSPAPAPPLTTARHQTCLPAARLETAPQPPPPGVGVGKEREEAPGLTRPCGCVRV